MNIQKIKERIISNKGRMLRFKFNGTRNQIEEFEGVILGTYNCIFLVQMEDDNHLVKSFTYSDVLTNSLQIYFVD